MQPQLLASMRKVFPSAQWKDDLAHQSGHVDSPEECYANLLKAVEKLNICYKNIYKFLFVVLTKRSNRH